MNSSTRIVVVEFSIYNPNLNLFAIIKMGVEFPASGMKADNNTYILVVVLFSLLLLIILILILIAISNYVIRPDGSFPENTAHWSYSVTSSPPSAIQSIGCIYLSISRSIYIYIFIIRVVDGGDYVFLTLELLIIIYFCIEFLYLEFYEVRKKHSLLIQFISLSLIHWPLLPSTPNNQLTRQKKKYFRSAWNYYEWIMILVG